ncbi:hypothetical protein PENTCL1PPCAC_21785, partial [Pristionchus entomophagus]
IQGMRAYLLLISLAGLALAAEDFYTILGVAKDADDRTIRRAFKKLAVAKHPDKNPHDKNAHSEFVTINRAYEVLKDEELRKKYDQYGEEGLKDDFQAGGQQYQSWQFYNENFGIYDEDQEITTLSRADFQKNVLDSGEIWFVNFYSTFCSHCHTLAPTWRQFAQAMEGVIRVGAVNCAEDPMLCQSQRVMGYPSLVLYPSGAFYQGQRAVDVMIDFAMKYVKAEILHLTKDNYVALTEEWRDYADKPWIIDFCDDTERCLSPLNRRKLSAMLAGMVNVGTVNCVHGQKEELCEELGRTEGVVYYPAGNVDTHSEKELSSLDPRELASAALSYMPKIEKAAPETVKEMFEHEEAVGAGSLLYFVNAAADVPDEMKKLPIQFPNIKINFAECSKLDGLCEKYLDPAKLPTAVLFKKNIGYDINYGKSSSARDVSSFIRESMVSPLVVLSAERLQAAIASGELWMIDYFAPWCPPCMKLMGELRRVHSTVEEGVELANLKIGTVDCVKYKDVCQRAGIQSYPTSHLHFDGKLFRSVGSHTADKIVEFIDNSLHPSVVELTPESFEELVANRAEDETWIVDFFAPWCGPCQQLAPEYQKVARGFSDEEEEKLHFGSVDCQAHGPFCGKQGVRGYPTIRAYAHRGAQPKDYPANMWRNADSISRWVYSLLPSLVADMGNEFFTDVLTSSEPWLVDFYAPWCGHCVQFAPYFEQIAKALEGRVKLAKINCDAWPQVCSGAQIRAFPTIRFFIGSNGGPQNHFGLAIQSHHRDQIISIIEQQLGSRQIRDEL